MKRALLGLAVFALAALVAPAQAFFHLFRIDQIYTNADGTVQYVVMREITGSNNENMWAGNFFQTMGGPAGTQSIQFPSNLPSDTASKKVLIATPGFASLNLVAPDYMIPAGFIPLNGGSLSYASGTDSIPLPVMPTDGATAIDRFGTHVPATPTNFAGDTTTLTAAAPAVNYQGLWWASPAGSESGWGINFAHQDEVIFATWFTYDLAGKGWWLSMTANKTADNVYSGALFQTTGPAFSAMPFDPAKVVATQVGTATLTFTDANTAQFNYTVTAPGAAAKAAVTQVKTLTREVFGALPTCTFGAQPNLALATNFEDLWWAAPAGSESGWGINLTEEGNVIFATWFTYDVDGTPLWLVVTANSTGANTFSGTLFRTTGPPFNAVPFDPAKVVSTPVGTATFTFTDGNHAAFTYTVNGVMQAKPITRQVFRDPGTVCVSAAAVNDPPPPPMNPYPPPMNPPPYPGYPGG